VKILNLVAVERDLSFCLGTRCAYRLPKSEIDDPLGVFAAINSDSGVTASRSGDVKAALSRGLSAKIKGFGHFPVSGLICGA